MLKILICGTKIIRKKLYDNIVRAKLNSIKEDFEIIEGCCPYSADQYAEEWASCNDVKVNHYPSTKGNYLKRNIEMVKACDKVIAFWDGFSYGTAHTIATAVCWNKPVSVVMIK